MALSYREESTEYAPPQNMGMHGLIFTNLHLLAGKLEVDEQILITILMNLSNRNGNTGSRTNLSMPVIIRTRKVVFWETRRKHI